MKPIISEQYPLPAKGPRNPVASKDKIKRVFGIEMPHWEDPLRAFLFALPGPELNQNYAWRALVGFDRCRPPSYT